MPAEKANTQEQTGWRKDGDDASGKVEKKHKKTQHKGKAAAPLLPSQSFKSARTVVVEG